MIELKVIAALIVMLVIVVFCTSCYRAGMAAADDEWLASATDPARVVTRNGRHYFAQEFVEDYPEVEFETGREPLD